MASFSFTWDCISERLIIRKLPEKQKKNTADAIVEAAKRNGWGAGCGNTTEWSKMAAVKAPVEFDDDPSSTKYVIPIPAFVSASWNSAYDKAIGKLEKLKIKRAR